MLTSPVANNYVVAGDTLAIQWAKTNITNIKIEYLFSNSVNYSTIINNVITVPQIYYWAIPAELNGNCKIKISDTGNPLNYSLSENISVLKSGNVGGPYLYDKNTLLLMHFDNDLNSRTRNVSASIGNSENLTRDQNSPTDLGRCYRTGSLLKVPHHPDLNLSGDWTIEAWVKLSSLSTDHNMYLLWKPGDSDSYQSNFAMEVNPWWGNVFYAYYFSEVNTRIGVANFTPILNEWYHIAFIRDVSKKMLKILIHDKNRRLVSENAVTYSNSDNTYINSQDLQIGTDLDGYIDEVRVSNIVRDFVATAVDNYQEVEFFSFYPNPAEGKINILNPSIAGELTISDIQGRVLRNIYIEPCSNFFVDLSGLQKGIYLIQFKTPEKNQTKKLVMK
jgi:hypothetical protein